MPIKTKGKVLRMPAAHPKGTKQYHLSTVECTGKGDLLCYETFGGRLFRCSEKGVKDAVDEYVRQYNRICAMYDEDPAHEYYETTNYNELYELLPILPSDFGERYGFSNSDEYRVALSFDIKVLDAGMENDWFGMLDEPLLLLSPSDGCYPFEYYMEV